MKDYRPLLSNVAILIEELVDLRGGGSGDPLAGDFSYDLEETQELLEGVNEMFNEIDYEVEGHERF